MNKLAPRSFRLLTAALVGLLLQVFPAAGQAPSAIRSADFIVAVVNSEPVTNSEVQTMFRRMQRELVARGAPVPPAAQLTQQALDMLSESESSPILSQLTSIGLKLGKLADIDDKLKPEVDALEPARIQLQEAVYALNDYLGRIELDPERLTAHGLSLESVRSAVTSCSSALGVTMPSVCWRASPNCATR